MNIIKNTAILQIAGPIFCHENVLSQFIGGTALATFTADFQHALENPAIHQMILHIDSPGGTVSGIHEMAEKIYQARGKKPMVAYVSGLCASAAYWIACATDEIVIDETASVGSIGVVSVYYDETYRQQKEGIAEISIVSSQSPQKRLDIKTEEGRSQVQQWVDDIADVFVAKVARNRGVSIDTVLSKFGQGGLLVGRHAVASGLADRLGSLDQLLTQFSFTQPKKEIMMTDTSTVRSTLSLEQVLNDHPDIAHQLRAEGAHQERTRIQRIEAQTMPGHETLMAQLKWDGKTTAEEAAIQILAAEKSRQAVLLAQMKTQMSTPLPMTAPVAENPTPILSGEAAWKHQWDTDPNVQAEFGGLDTYLAFKKAESRGQIQILQHTTA